ncbi:hypothetical protein HPB47_005591 [Ixodes persulcatus]|uniref:Uncharacterized protein n=1 Tax=Ixodes persulcatus TaxID=34615 RepID=A0AC60PD35_IXOPE|nr:hypothetical protein HPB47_005591 [Ixodes persulcatus]
MVAAVVNKQREVTASCSIKTSEPEVADEVAIALAVQINEARIIRINSQESEALLLCTDPNWPRTPPGPKGLGRRLRGPKPQHLLPRDNCAIDSRTDQAREHSPFGITPAGGTRRGEISDRSERPVVWGSGRHPGRPRGPLCGARLAVHRREGCATCPNAVAALNASSALLGGGHFLVGRAALGAPRGPPRSFKDGRPLAKDVVERGDVTTANDAVDADDTHGMPAISVRRPAFRQTRSHG